VAPEYIGGCPYWMGGTSGEDGRTARPRGSASRSSTIAVSATATPDRCWSRAAKSATIASIFSWI